MAQKIVEKKVNKYIFSHPSGKKCYPKRELKRDNTGLAYIGYVTDVNNKLMYDDWYEKIQKPKDSCNVRILLERAVASDNTAILNQRDKISADLSGLPNNLLDVMNQFQGVKHYFETLPVEVKKDFSNNVFEFVKRQGHISETLKNYYKSIQKTPLQPTNIEDKNDRKDGDV